MKMHRGLVGLVVVLAASCDCGGGEETDECVYNSTHYQVGAVFSKGDDCNQCTCGAGGAVSCTSVTCNPDGGTGDGGAGDGSAADTGWDAGPATNEVVPIPDTDCVVTSINGAPASAAIKPGDVVGVSAASYPAPTSGATVTQVDWSLALAPAGSHALVDPRRSVETTLVSATGLTGVDLGGTYVLRALVMDDTSATASHDCKIEVTPVESFYVELVWDRSQSDVDLHVTKKDADGAFCLGGLQDPVSGTLGHTCVQAPLDCNFSNCRENSTATSPDWDSNSVAHSAGDPLLVIDDLDGFGPEVIRSTQIPAGDYLVGAYFWNDAGGGATTVTVRVWLNGQLRGQNIMSLTNKQWWEPFVITWPASGDVCIADPAVNTPATCHPAPQCTPAATCDQCTDNSACGPGSHCQRNRCRPDVAVCINDTMCAAGRACIPATDACAQAACSGTCLDRQVCAPDILACYLPPAVCTETDEPNDATANAIVVSNNHYAGVLCRGDVDFLKVTGHAGKRLRVAIGVANPDYALTADLRDATGNVVATRPLSASETILHTIVTTTASYYVVMHGTGVQTDSWNYTIDVTEPDPPTVCVSEPGEPNETLGAASVLSSGSSTRGICASNDQDWHLITAPAQRQLVVSTTWDHAYGGLDVSLLAGGQTFTTYQTDTGLIVYKYSNRSNDPTSTYLHVAAAGYGASDEPFTYAVAVWDQPLPVCVDTFEPNETIQTAARIAAGTFNGAICDNTDKDFFSIQLTRTGAIHATLSFSTSEADLDLFLLRSNGATEDSAAGSSSPEVVDGTGLAVGTYVIEVRRYALRADLVTYSLAVTTPNEPIPDAGMADAANPDAAPPADAASPADAAATGDAAHDAGVMDSAGSDF